MAETAKSTALLRLIERQRPGAIGAISAVPTAAAVGQVLSAMPRHSVFYPTKNTGALGDAGRRNHRRRLARKVRMLRNYGSERSYHHEMSGLNCRHGLSIQAAILREKPPMTDAENAARTAHNRSRLRPEIRNSHVILPADTA